MLETPRIGGIVGIGQSELVADPVKTLVIEGILTTLLNVVGSVKAIYKYTSELEYYATRDPLTNLYNQRMFWELLGYEMERARRYNYRFSILISDLDNFKVVNDTYGHVFGDKFLQEFGSIKRKALKRGDILARYGGDEFVAILPESDEEQAYLVARRIMEGLKTSPLMAPDESRLRTTVSIGIAVFPEHAGDGRDLFLMADNMMYRAKSLGRDRIGIPTHEDVAEIFRGLGEKKVMVMKAVEERRVIPYFQPILNLKTREIEAYEILVRIDLPPEMVQAHDFIEIAEGIGIINRIDHIVMEKAFERVRERGWKGGIFINLSPKALILHEFIPNVKRLVREFGIEPGRVVFEITERDTVKNITLLERFVLDLKMEGFRFAIDDFGSGFSSFQYIKRFSIDFIKVEGDFIRAMSGGGEMDRAIVESITTLARGIGVKTIAEHVEDEEVLKAIEGLGLDYAQGYQIGRPSPKMTIED